MAKNELTTVEKFNLVTGMEEMDEELKAELEDELGDLDEENGIICRQIKIPSGGGKAFEVESDDPDDPEVMKEISGVIIFTHRANAYWEHKYGEGEDGNNEAPTCSSMDGKVGVRLETGEMCNCDTCPYNEYGVDGSGKPCKNIRRIYMLIDGMPGVYLLSVPPTSIKDVNRQLARIMGHNKIPYTRMVMKFKLDVATNKANIKYSKVVVDKEGILPAEMFKITASMRKELKEKYTEIAITGSDYTMTPPGTVERNMHDVIDINNAGFVQADAKEEVPFN